MSENTNTSSAVSRGMGFTGWLTLVLIVLKLNPGGYLDSAVTGWSWWLVFAPLLIAWGLLGLILLGFGVLFLSATAYDKYREYKRKKNVKATKNMTPGERRDYYMNKRKK